MSTPRVQQKLDVQLSSLATFGKSAGSRPLKVAFVSYDFPEYSVRLASSIAAHCQVLAFLPREFVTRYRSLVVPELECHYFANSRLRHIRAQIRTMAHLRSEIEAFAPDVIHLQGGHLWFNLLLPWLRPYPLVLTIHDYTNHLGDKESLRTPFWIIKFGYRCAAQIIVHSGWVKSLLEQHLKVSADKIHVVPHIALGEPELCRSEDDVPTVLFFGRLWPYKGLENLIRAQPMISARIPEAKIIIAGEGEDFSRYRRMMRDPENFIIYNEYVSDENRRELFSRAAVVVLPYVEASQSGVVPLAYRFEKPVVATSVGGLPEMIEHGRTGLLVQPNDSAELAEAILRLLENPELRHRFGRNGLRKLEEQWSASLVAERTVSVYRVAAGTQGFAEKAA